MSHVRMCRDIKRPTKMVHRRVVQDRLEELGQGLREQREASGFLRFASCHCSVEPKEFGCVVSSRVCSQVPDLQEDHWFELMSKLLTQGSGIPVEENARVQLMLECQVGWEES